MLFIFTYYLSSKRRVLFTHIFKKFVLIDMLCEMQFRVKSEFIDFKIFSLDFKGATLKRTS